MAGKKAGRRKDKQSEKEFSELLTELHEATKSATSGKGATLVTKAERRQKQEQREADAKKKREDELQQMLEKQQQQQRMRAIIERLMRQPSGFLAKPKTELSFESKSSTKFSAAAAWMQGWRESMEDSHFMLPTFQDGGLFGVFDGHAGTQSGVLCRTALPAVIMKHTTAQGIDFTKAFTSMDEHLRSKVSDDSGCTAVVVYINDRQIVCASVGDSRAVLCRGKTAIPLSEDHKPEVPLERERIESAGGTVSQNRVNGQLAMSRALGDFQYKRNDQLPMDRQLVVPIPDIVVKERTSDDAFVLIACDGIFDVLSNEEAIAFVVDALEKDPKAPLEEVCGRLCQRCLSPPGDNGMPARPEGTDNMTAMLIKISVSQ